VAQTPSERRARLAREQYRLSPSTAFGSVADESILVRFLSDDPEGWLFERPATEDALAWLERFDLDTWNALAVTGDAAWGFAPIGRQRPDLAAFSDGEREPMAIVRRPWGSPVRRLTIGGATLRLRPGFNPLRQSRRLHDDDGLIARVTPHRSSGRYCDLTWSWERFPAMPDLVALLVTYTVTVERATAVDVPVTDWKG
jgi:hypothetical protein